MAQSGEAIDSAAPGEEPVKPVTKTVRVPHIVIVAGEPSGDALGGQLMAALGALTKNRVRITGVGGPSMEAQGMESLFPISDTSVMGLSEVLPAIPRILKRVRQTADYIEHIEPDVVVLIDSPDFTHRIARRLSKRAPWIRVVKYVAPQVWASRPKRAAKLAEIADCVLTLLPFEPPWFTREGMRAEFVGHPVVERVEQMAGGAAFRKRHDIAPDVPLLLMLPGSRSNEIRYLMPAFTETVRLLKDRVPGLVTVLPMVPHVAEKVDAATQDWPTPLHLVSQDEKFAAFDAADVALATSGTVTTELALARVPMVVAYRAGWLTGEWAKRIVIAPFATLINLIEERGVVPEFLQEAVEPPVLAEELYALFTDETAAQRQKTAMTAALTKMGLGQESPSLRAARAVIAMIGDKSATKKQAREIG